MQKTNTILISAMHFAFYKTLQSPSDRHRAAYRHTSGRTGYLWPHIRTTGNAYYKQESYFPIYPYLFNYQQVINYKLCTQSLCLSVYQCFGQSSRTTAARHLHRSTTAHKKKSNSSICRHPQVVSSTNKNAIKTTFPKV